MKQVLFIRSEKSLGKKLVKELQKEEHFHITSHDENNNVAGVMEREWDMILVEWSTVSKLGLAICRKIRASQTTPIIIVSDYVSSKDCVAGLEAGADDYIRIPFEKEELVARIHVLLKRCGYLQPNDQDEFFYFKDLIINTAHKIVLKNGENIALTKREYSLLVFLIKHKNTIMSREVLLNQVWGYDIAVNPNVVDLYIGYLRKKLQGEKKDYYIQTIHGRGYSMVE